MRYRPVMLTLLFSVAAAASPPDGACPPDRACRVDRVHPAGRTPSGDPIEVVELAHYEGEPPGPHDEKTCPVTSYWRTGGGLAPVKLLELCNDGYGASGVGEDSISVSENRFSIGRYGGSAWRWSSAWTVQLVPLALLQTSADSFHSAAPEHTSTSSNDLQAGIWTTSWSHPTCGEGTHLRVPHAPGLKSVDASVALGSCSARASADGTQGHVAWGPKGTSEDGRLATTIIGQNTLLVDIYDDHQVRESSSWIHADHLELWLGRHHPDPSMDWDCHPPDPPPAQWGITLDGHVHAGQNAVGKAPQATVDLLTDRVRMVVTLPGPELPSTLSVVFSDADPTQDGTPRQERLVATSPVSMKRPWTHGGVARLQATTCAVQGADKGGRLELVPVLSEHLANGGALDSP